MVSRRRFLQILSASALPAPLGAEAQPPGKVPRIGYLSSGTPTANATFHKAFVDGLRDHGWTEGKTLTIEYRWDTTGESRLDVLAVELARLPLDAIFAVNTPAALAMKRSGGTVPVVFAQVSEPVGVGLVESLARPGHNFTGLTTINRELMSKRLELLKEALPGLTRVGYLAHPGYVMHQAQLTEMQATTRSLGLTLHLSEVRAPSDFEGAFAHMVAAHVGAFIVQQDDLFRDNRARILELAAQRRLPGMYAFSFYTSSGGFVSYGANGQDLYRRAAGYVDRILRGAKPAALPVERPTRFELAINMKTAKALGLTIPQPLLLRVDQIIE
jgi:putative ABC transport system substrate-binding protein